MANSNSLRIGERAMKICDARNRPLARGINQAIERYWAIYQTRREAIAQALGAETLKDLDDTWQDMGGARNEDVATTLQRLAQAAPSRAWRKVAELSAGDRVLLLELLEERAVGLHDDDNG